MKTYKLLAEMIHGPTNLKEPPSGSLEKELRSQHTFIAQKTLNSINQYTSEMGGEINRNLHIAYNNRGKGHSSGLSRHYSELVSSLDRVTTQKEAPRDFHVYSGLKEPITDEMSGLRKDPNDPHHRILPAYTSTYIDHKVGHEHALAHGTNYVAHMLKIHIPHGSKHGAFIGHYSDFPEEKEFLLKRNTKLHVHPEPEIHRVPDNPETGIKAHTLHIYHAKIVE